MNKVAAILGLLVSFIVAGVFHFQIQSLAGKKNPLIPQDIYADIDATIEEYEIYRLSAFLTGVLLLFITIFLFNKTRAENPDLIDDIDTNMEE